jgi:nitrilase
MNSNAKNVRVAVVQASSIPFDSEACVDKAVQLTADAAARGAKVLVFPEAFIAGYPKGLSYGLVVGARDPVGREEFRLYLDAAIEVPGPQTQRLGEAAAAHGVHLVIGVIERDGGTLYCTALFLGPSGAFLGKHRKLMPTAAERLVWGYGDGSTLPVLDTELGRLGAVICWENYMPLLRMSMYAKGIQIWCAPTADHRDTWVSTMQHVACEGRCFVLSANQFARRSDYPADYPIDGDPGPDEVLCRGGSVIVSPLGEILAGPEVGGEAILRADLDLSAIAEAKYDFDVVGHYARPDVFRLTVNEQPAPAVVVERSA